MGILAFWLYRSCADRKYSLFSNSLKIGLKNTLYCCASFFYFYLPFTISARHSISFNMNVNPERIPLTSAVVDIATQVAMVLH